MATKEEQIAQIEKNMKVYQDELNRLRDDAGQPTDMLATHTQESALVALWRRLTGEEKMKLMHEDPEKWEQMLDAVHLDGMRQLYHTNP